MIIGLTGGIASGKSTAAKQLAEWGAHMIDADKLGHRAYVSGSQAFDQVVATFGEEVVGEDGEVDRKILGQKVFADGNRLDELTAIVWPAIRAMAETEINEVKSAQPERHIVLEAAVMIEAGWMDLVDTLWVTVVDPSVAIARASERDGVDASQVQARIDAQLTNEERIAHAQVVIDNSGTEAELIQQLKAQWDALA